MAKIRSKNTAPELMIRKVLHKNGLRFRLHCKKLPGTPDLVFPKYQAVLFVNGCFWHGHKCSDGTLPSSNVKFWKTKIQDNKKRDGRNIKELLALGFKILVIWQCALKGKHRFPIEIIGLKVKDFLSSDNNFISIKGE